MKRPVSFVWPAFVLLILPQIPSAGIYQYQDKNGNVVYSDSPPSGTEAREKQFQEQRFDGSHLSPAGGQGRSEGDIGRAPEERVIRRRCQRDPLFDQLVRVLRTGPELPPVARRAACRVRHEADAKRAAEMRQKSGGSKGVPLIDVEGIILRGFSEESIDAAVEKKKAEQ